MNKNIAIKNLLFKRNVKLLTDNSFKKSNVPPDVEKYAKDLLTKEFFSQSCILTYISMSIIAAIIIKNSDIQQTEHRCRYFQCTLYRILNFTNKYIKQNSGTYISNINKCILMKYTSSVVLQNKLTSYSVSCKYHCTWLGAI